MGKSIKEQISDQTLGKLYLFYGEEPYLIRLNTERILQAVLPEEDRMMNLERVGKFDEEALKMSVSTFPFLAERRIVIVEDSALFSGEKGREKVLEALLKEQADTTILIFQEKKVDKRTKAYKLLCERGEAFEYQPLEERELLAFIALELKKYPVQMGKREALLLLSYTGSDMEKISSELEKVAGLCLEKGRIEAGDIEAIVSPTLESRIFALTDALGEGNTAKAYETYRLLISQNEPIPRIVYMIARQYDLLLRAAAYLAQSPRTTPDELAGALKIQRFLARNYLQLAGRYGKKRLEEIVSTLAEADYRVKSGLMSEEEAMSLILTLYTKRE